MKTQIKSLNLILTAALTTLTMTACGSNTLPSELTESSVGATQTPTYLPLTGYATPSSIQVGQTSAIVASEGQGGYTFTASTAAFGTLSGNVFTGTVVGDTVVTIHDKANGSFPVTIKVVATTVVVPPPPATIQIYRYLMATQLGELARVFNESATAPAGYTYEGVSFPILKDNIDGTVAIRECRDLTFVTSLFQSTDANCEGQTPGRILGYVWTSPGAGRVAVRRYSQNYSSPFFGPLTDRLLIIDPAPGPQNYGLDGILGYIPAP